MLFYSQLKREFKKLTWKRGQTYFRDSRVSDVRMDGDLVMGKVKGTDETAYDTAIVMARGTILNSKCSCPAHRLYEAHCKHVAALAIWIVERGSLLRSGAGGLDYGVAEGASAVRPLVVINQERAKRDMRLRKLFQMHPVLLESSFTITRTQNAAFIEGKEIDGRTYSVPITLVEAAALHTYMGAQDLKPVVRAATLAEPVAFVRGTFQNRSLAALTIEPALRYLDPSTRVYQVVTTNHLHRQRQPGVWRTTLGLELQVPPIPGLDIPMLGKLESPKIIFTGPEALENLAALLMHKQRQQIVFDPSIQAEIDPIPLKLTSITVGKKGGSSRSVSYLFQNEKFKLSSEEMQDLMAKGHLSNEFVWKDGRIYRLETTLNRLSQHNNRSGVAQSEGPTQTAEGDEAPKSTGMPGAFGALYDDGENPLHPLAVYRLSLELGVSDVNVDPEWDEFHDWWKLFAKAKIPTLPKVEYGFQLRDYQINGLSWLWSLYNRGLSSLLADDMGLGKTHQVLALLTSLYRKRSPNRPKLPTLVIAPTSVVAAWIQKLQKYETSLKWHVFHGKGRALPKESVDLVLTTYGILQREPALRERDWHMVILDEAQAIKNSTTLSARSARALRTKFRIAMTGTPVENQATDLWSLMEFLIPGYLGSLTRFKRLYGGGRDPLSAGQAQALRRLTSPFLLRRTKAQVLKELPEKTEEIVHCQMTALQKQVYRAYLSSAEAMSVRASLEGSNKVDYAGILALLTRLKQVCDHPKLPTLNIKDAETGLTKKAPRRKINPRETGKWEAFEEILNEALGSNLKIVVFTQYLGMMDLVGESLKEKGVGYTELRGDTSDRAARLLKFSSDPECKVFVCSLLAGGLGIDLTSASVCIHLDRWWNPAKENQATDRLHRIGQTRGVQVFKLQIPGSVEDRIAGIIENKLALSDALIEESAQGLKGLSRKQLLDLLNPNADLGEDADETELDDGGEDESRVSIMGAGASVLNH